MNKLAKVQDLLDVQQLDALVILSDYNRRYLSDFTGTSGALIISKNNYQLLIFDILNKQLIKQLNLTSSNAVVV